MLRVPCAWDHPCEMPCKLPHKTFSIQLCHWINSKNSCRRKKHGFCHGRPIFQELCSPADANCCSVFADGFNWIVHLCHCADYFALINTLSCCSHNSKLATNLRQAVNLSFAAATRNWKAHMDVSNNFHSQLTPKILGFNPKTRMEALGAPPRICKACQDRRSVPKPREEEWFLVRIGCTASSTHHHLIARNAPFVENRKNGPR